MIFNIIIAALGSALLVWAAIVDSRTRKIPVAAGFGMLGLGLAVLVKEGWYIWAAYYILAIWCTRGGVWQAVLVVASIGILWAFEWEAAPLVLGITFVSLLFWRNWFGGGDSQLAFGLVGIGHDWLVLALLFGLTIVFGVGLTIIHRGGIRQGVQRLASVARRLGESPDSEAIRTPWGIVAAVAGVSYLWLWALVL
ncbi:MAG TPA: hypothetical protein VFI27_09035 [candidate division Zixibacteria bacterium]|nr:hypothetical protein [candidate division Zixibacteria bacterium]